RRPSGPDHEHAARGIEAAVFWRSFGRTSVILDRLDLSGRNAVDVKEVTDADLRAAVLVVDGLSIEVDCGVARGFCAKLWIPIEHAPCGDRGRPAASGDPGMIAGTAIDLNTSDLLQNFRQVTGLAFRELIAGNEAPKPELPVLFEAGNGGGGCGAHDGVERDDSFEQDSLVHNCCRGKPQRLVDRRVPDPPNHDPMVTHRDVREMEYPMVISSGCTIKFRQ